ncbi:MAG TPA: hypothetical protein VH083_12330 [Myxococcales bacterium]|nr:hypothetical protein [Myxococcales bacterium]
MIAQSDFTPLSGTKALPDSCDVTCRLGVAQKLETAAAATAELTSEGGQLDYKLTVRMVKSGEVVASVRASGKDLVELSAGVRAAAARLAGCRE